jgi:hypothetical protein
MVCAGFSAATWSRFSALVRTDSFKARLVFLAIFGPVFAVITCTKPLLLSSVWVSSPNVAGASACACAPTLKAIETDAVASAKKNGRLRTSARYARNQNPWQAFFSIKSCRCPLGCLPISGQFPGTRVSVVGGIVWRKSRRGSERVVVVDESTSTMSRCGVLFVRRDYRSAPGRHTQNQSPI